MTSIQRPNFSTIAPPITVAPNERIKEFTGDPNFMASLARGLAVIQAFQERKRQLTIAQISHRTEIPRAAVRRCLHTLIKLGYATSNGRTYSLLPKVLTLGHAYLSSNPLPVTAQPILNRLSEQLHETLFLATLEENEVLYIARSSAPHRLSIDLNVGSRLPAYCTSGGRILLAALDDGVLDEYLEQADTHIKLSRNLNSAQALRSCIENVRRQGWSIVDQELEAGSRSLSVPVCTPSGHVLAALNVRANTNFTSRQDLENRFLPTLLQASRELGAQLGNQA